LFNTPAENIFAIRRFLYQKKEKIHMESTANLSRPRWPRRGGALAFFMGFLRRPDLVGSVVPSSRFLERRLIESAGIKKAGLVVELGPGTGGTTWSILEALPNQSNLLAIELNPYFVPILNAVPDKRLTVHHGSAEHIREVLAEHGFGQPNAVVSGIPFSTMSPALGQKIIREVWSCLAPGGCFVAYQFRGHVARLERSLMGEPKVAVELLNVPPVRIYNWHKARN